MAFGESPVEVVGECVLLEIGEDFVVDLVGGEVGWQVVLAFGIFLGFGIGAKATHVTL